MTEKKVTVPLTGGTTGLIVFIVFLVLKLTHTIDWSWWLVTAPLWIGAAFALAITLVAVVLMMIFAICVQIKRLFERV